MTLTLLICGAIITLTAVFVVAKSYDAAQAILVDDRAGLPLSDPAAETLVGNSGPADRVRGEWQVATVAALRDAEDLLDSLEAQGIEHRELVILGNACFAVRWR